MRTAEGIPRRLRRAALAGLAAALALGAVAVVTQQVTRDDSPPDLTEAAAEPTTFAAYADQLLASTPGSWRSGASVVVVPAEAAGETEGTRLPADRVGPTVPLPAHAFELAEDWRAPGSDDQPEPGLTGRVLSDRGPALLACTEWPDSRGCTVSVGHLEEGGFVYDFGVGSDRFQAPGAEMEVFLMPSYTPAGRETLVLAGGSAPVESAVVILRDGTKVPATLTDVVGEPTGAIYFTSTAGTPVRVVAFDANGRVVEDHAIRRCRPGANCEVH